MQKSINLENLWELLENSSRYFSVLLKRFPEYRTWLTQKILHRFTTVELYRHLSEQLSSIPEEKLWEHFATTFRSFKQRHFIRLGARNLLGLDNFQDTVSQLSDIAITLLQLAVKELLNHPKIWLSDGDLKIWEHEKSNINVVVLALGKLGGKELNFVSDIDLLFLYHAKTLKGAGIAQALLPRFVQNISRLFSDIIDGDRVFIVDLRLRPGGKDGELVPSLDYAVHYYLLQGKSWDRLAFIKATPVAGDISLGNQFLREIQPFVFRRFLDFQAIDEMKRLRDQMLKETPSEEAGPGYNVKLGKGGIREIEFLVQSLQLIYGGRLRHLQEKNTLKCIDLLKNENLITKTDAEDLARAYVFLRNLEHWVQLQENRQTQVVPQNPSLQTMLLRALGFTDTESFFKNLRTHTEIVRYHFERLYVKSFEDSETTAPISANVELSSLSSWLEETVGKELGRDIVSIINEDEAFRISKNSAEIRLRQWAQAIARRPGLCRFLISSKARQNLALDRAIYTVVHLPLLSELLSRVPSLIESFAEEETGSLKNFHLWKKQAEEIIIGNGSLEEALLWLRKLKNERLLHIALWDTRHNPPIEDLEKEISLLADFFVLTTYRIACNHVLKCLPEDYPLVVSAMGKWGSCEMGYRSDLDLVFIYLPEEDLQKAHIPERVAKFIQRFVRLLSITLQDGPGYEVDMRLRPTGNYGPLVVTFPSWEEYYTQKADIWEIASLLRFRPVAGPPEMIDKLRSKIQFFCSKGYPSEKVTKRLCELKRRIENERTKETDQSIHLKLGKGGLIELEFWCQIAALTITGTMWELPLTVISALPKVFNFWNISEDEKRDLFRAFKIMRRLEHRFSLLGKSVEEFSAQDLDTLKNLQLWGYDKHSQRYQDWSDIQRFRRCIRSRWEKLCLTGKE